MGGHGVPAVVEASDPGALRRPRRRARRARPRHDDARVGASARAARPGADAPAAVRLRRRRRSREELLVLSVPGEGKATLECDSLRGATSVCTNATAAGPGFTSGTGSCAPCLGGLVHRRRADDLDDVGAVLLDGRERLVRELARTVYLLLLAREERLDVAAGCSPRDRGDVLVEPVLLEEFAVEEPTRCPTCVDHREGEALGRGYRRGGTRPGRARRPGSPAGAAGPAARSPTPMYHDDRVVALGLGLEPRLGDVSASKIDDSSYESSSRQLLRTGTQSTITSSPRRSDGICAARAAIPSSSKGNGMMYLIRTDDLPGRCPTECRTSALYRVGGDAVNLRRVERRRAAVTHALVDLAEVSMAVHLVAGDVAVAVLDGPQDRAVVVVEASGRSCRASARGAARVCRTANTGCAATRAGCCHGRRGYAVWNIGVLAM